MLLTQVVSVISTKKASTKAKDRASIHAVHADCTDPLVRGSFAAVGAWSGDSGKGQVAKACRSWNEHEHDIQQERQEYWLSRCAMCMLAVVFVIMINGCL